MNYCILFMQFNILNTSSIFINKIKVNLKINATDIKNIKNFF